jgi:molecular chaperone GrpE
MTQHPANDGKFPDAAQDATSAAPMSGTEADAARMDRPEAASTTASPDTLQALTAERDELKDRLLRTLADMENLRRRTEKEMADARAYAMANFARDMLGVADNLRRALDNLPAETHAAADASLKAMLDGVDITERDLIKTFERHGVRQIDPKGEKFDPNRHQAMFEAPDPNVPKGMVTQVVQVGYSIGERVLRPALVGVSAGGPKVSPVPNGADSTSPDPATSQTPNA